VTPDVERDISPLSLRGAKRRRNPACWIATPSFLGLAMTGEIVSPQAGLSG
jgi:hypothetical protein